MAREQAVKKRKYQPQDETREILYRAAMGIMEQKGFQGTTIRDICTAAKVPVGTFYHCFSSKMELFRQNYEKTDDFFLTTVAEETEHLPLDQGVEQYARRYAQITLDTGLEMSRVLFHPANEWFVPRRPMQQVLLALLQRGKERGELPREADCDQMVDEFFDLLRGTSYNWCVRSGDFDLEARMVRLAKRYLKGVQTELAESGKQPISR